VQQGQQDQAQTEMTISRELANKTLARDKSALTGLTDASGLEGAQVPAEVGAAIKADPLALRRVEAMREQIKLPVADSYNNLGAIAATNSKYSDAVTYFKRASVWNPSLEGLDYNWGRAAFAGSQFADAVLPLSRYVRSHEDDSGARSVLAISQFMTGNYQGCIEALESVIGKTDLVPQVEYVYAASLVRAGQVPSGVERLMALEKLHPEIPDIHRELGEALDQQGEKKRAFEELRTAVELSPRDGDSHYDLGKIEFEGGDAAAAIPELEAATRLLPNNDKFHHELADAYTAVRRPIDAQKEMETYKLLRARLNDSASSHQGAAPEQ
jgi:tetratricopeptide (TPR) repeat protein